MNSISAMIVSIVLLIFSAISLLFAAPTSQYSGGNESNTSQMSAVISALTRRIDPVTAVDFGKLFAGIYHARNIPPVITLDDIKHSLRYQPSMNFRTSVHIGQRKLFLSELQFLTGVKDDILCVYVGAAPSNHTGYLSTLFPNVKFLLIDPNPFDIFEASPIYVDNPTDDMSADNAIKQISDGNARIYIINDIFTHMLARAIGKLSPDAYFISDVRTNMISDHPLDIDILWNTAQQYNWMQLMKPKKSMLKFRHPFYGDKSVQEHAAVEPYASEFKLAAAGGLDFIANYSIRRLTYWDGEVRIQAFPGQTSTETRLIVTELKLRDWGEVSAYEDKLYYYNSIERCFGHHVNTNANRELGFDHCADCSLENHIWVAYLTSIGVDTKSVLSYVKKLSAITHRPLIRDRHGRFFGPYPLDKLARDALNARPFVEKRRESHNNSRSRQYASNINLNI